MSFSKFRLLLIFLGLPSFSFAFTLEDCLNANYSTEIKHKVKPFGLVENKLAISKSNCVIEVSHEKMKVFKSRWQIDVCREPVHIKEGLKAFEVLKRTQACQGHKDEFCSSLKKLSSVIQDDGLIFAEGEKEELRSDHGKIYCSYQLIQRYLGNGLVLSRYSGNKGNVTTDPNDGTGSF